MAGSVLIVDDDPVQRRLLSAAVTRYGYACLTAADGQAGLAALEGGDVSVVVLDLVMPGVDGIGVLKAMRERGMTVPVIVQTARGGIDTVVGAMRNGAFDFVVKPASPERLKAAIEGALKVEALGTEARRGGRRAAALTFKDIITRSAAMERVLRVAQKAAASTIPVLIEGESGVGKELVARAIRGSGDRRARPFVTVNCGAIPENLVESILFGHEKGSFTGATEKHIGKFVEADTGTLFLDEIGDLPLDTQVKLLRAVQDGEVDPVGGRATAKVDIRLISATHRNLLEQVKEGKFREDLFYRLNVFPITVPPLRERRDDIPLLVQHFLGQVPDGSGRAQRVHVVTPEALAMLSSYDWPGNIRQLENAVFRAVVLAEASELGLDEFPHIRAQVEGVIDLDAQRPLDRRAARAAERPEPAVAVADAREGAVHGLDERGEVRTLAEIELDMIRMAIDRYQGQMSEVARRLGIGRSTLYRKMREHGIDPDRNRSE